jgi:hypothetical protein
VILALVDEVFGGQAALYRDGQIVVCRVRDEDLEPLFLILGQGGRERRHWEGELGRHALRAVGLNGESVGM